MDDILTAVLINEALNGDTQETRDTAAAIIASDILDD